MKEILLILLVLLISRIALAEEFNEKKEMEMIAARLVQSETADAESFFRMWVNPGLEETLSKTQLDDEGIKAVYEQFRDTITTPSGPHDREQFGMKHGAEEWTKIYQLGMVINSMLFYLPEEEIEKYGSLLWAMRDTLYVNLQYVAWGIEGNFSRDDYFYTLYNKWLQKAENAYSAIKGSK
jgi:hypothetical protein